MRNIISVLAGLVLLASCSTPKYSYHFDYYDYNSGKKNAEAVLITQSSEVTPSSEEVSPLLITEDQMTASVSETPTPPPASPSKTAKKVEPTVKKYSDLSKSEKKEFRKALKTELKKYIKAKKSDDGTVGKETKAMDYNLKMAIIFGAVAVTLSFFGGVNSVFWILSVVSLVVAVVFFVKWIAEQ